MDYVALGQRLREERKKVNLTQEKLAEKIDVSDAYIGQIERGERSLSLETLVKLTNELGVTIDYLLQESIEPSNEMYIKQLAQLFYNRPHKQKQMAVDVIKVMYGHLDNE